MSRRPQLLKDSELLALGQLTKGWDGYDAPPPAAIAIESAQRLLDLATYDWRRPDRTAPSVVGGIGVTFRSGGRKAYFEFYNTGSICLLFSDGISEPEVVRLGGDDASLEDALAKSRQYVDLPAP